MSIKCDNCNEDLTPGRSLFGGEDSWDKHIIALNGKKVCLCTNCFIVFSDWCCSDDHKKKLKEYMIETNQIIEMDK